MAPPTLPWRTSRLDLVRAREIGRPLQEIIRHGVTIMLRSGYGRAAVQYQGAGRAVAQRAPPGAQAMLRASEERSE